MVSDIPVGSPPVPPGRHAAPGGWYPDPTNVAQERYWDGWQWSRNTRSVEQSPRSGPAWPSPPPAGASPSQPYSSQPPSTQQPNAEGPPTGQPGWEGSPGQLPYGQQPYPHQYGQQPYPSQQYGPPQYGGPGFVSAGARPGPVTADGVPLAGWWWRVLASIIDSVILSLIVALPSIGVYSRLVEAMSVLIVDTVRAAQEGRPAPPVPDVNQILSPSDQLLLVVIPLVAGMLYHSAFVRLKGATPGKSVCGLRVVPVDRGRYAGKLAWATAFVRATVWVVPAAVGYLGLIRLLDALFPLWHPRRQALHDLAAKTQVVKIR